MFHYALSKTSKILSCLMEVIQIQFNKNYEIFDF